MMTLRLNICYDLSKTELVAKLQKVYICEEVVCNPSNEEPKAVIDKTENADVLILTDKSTAVETVDKKENVYIIYMGNYVDIADFAHKADDVWPADEAYDFTVMRFERFLSIMYEKHRAWTFNYLLDKTINSMPDLLWYKRTDGIHMLVNDVFAQTVHKEKEDIVGKDHYYIWDAPRPAEGEGEFACAESEEIAIRTGQTYIGEETVETREGMKQLLTYKTPIYNKFGSVFGTVGIGHDITTISNLGIELTIIVDNIPFPMIVLSHEGKVVRTNAAFDELAKVTDKESFNYKEWKEKALKPSSQAHIDYKKHYAAQEYTMDRNGSEYSYIVTEQEIWDYFDTITGYFCLFRDMTSQRNYEKRIIEAATTDSLTGIFNRRYFYDYVSEHAHSPMTLLYMDLDYFKEINDKYGHDKGDYVLKKTAQILRDSRDDSVTARLGGDEYAMIINKMLSQDELSELCTRLEKTIEDTFAAEGLKLSLSVGTAVTDGSISDVDAFIKDSDSKMYESKQRHHSKLKGK
ncbi:MAG: diguanylate cyclase [Lachnospiraceae bacterium]|nr:diguanylate cyclase [Lachnospiraceae bacterium]